MADNQEVKRMKYSAISMGGRAIDIVLEVPQPPMGDGSGYIPPPIIDFHYLGRTMEFVYTGQEG